MWSHKWVQLWEGSVLDEATCELVTRRARFDPAKNNQGRAVAGNYSSAVRWQLPD